MEREHPAALPDDRLLADCRVSFTRRSGPGGQNRNKVETAVVLKHLPTGIVVEANERRSQSENRRVALDRLRRSLAVSIRIESAEDQAVSNLWKSRRRDRKIAINPAHVDFPALLAEALDAAAKAGWDVAAAAARLGCSSSQLVKLFKHEPKAMELVNRQRELKGLNPLL